MSPTYSATMQQANQYNYTKTIPVWGHPSAETQTQAE